MLRAAPSRWIVLATLGVVLLVALVLALGPWGRADPAPSAPQPADPADPAEALSLTLDRMLQRSGVPAAGVVLRPLAAPDAPADTALLAERTCAALADRLARLPGLRVVPCRASAGAAASGLDDTRLARLLAVRHVLHGAIEPGDGDRVNVRLALHAPATGQVAWQIDQGLALAELQALPARVSAAVAAALGVADLPPPPAMAPETYARFVRAAAQARRPSIEDRQAAVRLLDEVVAAEPSHLDAVFVRHGLQGWLLGNDASGGSGTTVERLNAARAAHVAEGLALAQRLVAADPQDLRGQWLLLGHEMEVRQMVQGFARLDALLQRAAQQPGVLRLAARLHLHAGYVARARQLALEAARLNALDAEAHEILALTAGIERRDAELREFIAIARQVGHQGMGRAEVFEAWRRRDWAEVERAHAAWVGWGGQWSSEWVPAWARALAEPAGSPAREAAARMLDGHDAATRQHFVSYFVEYALLGDTARSLKAVQHHAALPPATWMQHLWWPEFAEVRRAPGFVEAMEALGFVALWEARGAPDFCRRADEGRWRCG